MTSFHIIKQLLVQSFGLRLYLPCILVAIGTARLLKVKVVDQKKKIMLDPLSLLIHLALKLQGCIVSHIESPDLLTICCLLI